MIDWIIIARPFLCMLWILSVPPEWSGVTFKKFFQAPYTLLPLYTYHSRACMLFPPWHSAFRKPPTPLTRQPSRALQSLSTACSKEPHRAHRCNFHMRCVSLLTLLARHKIRLIFFLSLSPLSMSFHYSKCYDQKVGGNGRGNSESFSSILSKMSRHLYFGGYYHKMPRRLIP